MQLSLHPKQYNTFLSKATEILFGGAAGGGKSHLMRVAAILWCAAIPGLQVYLFRRTYNDLLKNHMEGPGSFYVLLNDWLLDGWVSIVGDKEIRFWNGSKIHLCHCQHDKDRFNYLGAEIHVLLMDELTTFSEVVYRYLRSRVRMAETMEVPEQFKDCFPRILCSSNPGNIGHNWVRKSFVVNAPEGQCKQMPKSEGGMLRQFVRSLLEDNPSLDPNEYEGKLEGLGDPELVRAMRHGDWDIAAGGMLDDVWNPAKHIIQPFAIPHDWRIDRSFDWGSSKPFSVGWWAESTGSSAKVYNPYYGQPREPQMIDRSWPRGTLFRINEWYGWNGNDNEGLKMTSAAIAEGIKEREISMGIRGRVMPGPADSSIFTTEDGHCIEAEMRMKGVRWLKANKSPGSRKLGWEKIRSMLTAGTQYPMEDPGLFVFDVCTDGFIRTVPTLPRDERDRDDVDTHAEDHTGDETRYRVLRLIKTADRARIVGA